MDLDTLSPPPPYAPRASSSSCTQSTRLYTSDHARPPIFPAVPSTNSREIPTFTINSLAAPFVYNKEVGQQTIISFLSECRKNKTGSRFMIKQFKQPLVLYEAWSGHSIRLCNHRETILMHGSILAYDTVQLENKRSNITVDGSIVCNEDIYVKIDQGSLMVHGLCMAAKNMHIEVSHSPLQLQCLLEAKRLNIKMKNAPLVLNQVSLVKYLDIRAEKASVEINIVDFTSNTAKIDIETSHAFVTVYLPHQFSGEFSLESKKGTVAVNNRSQVGVFDYKHKERYRIEGYFKHGRYANHRIHIKTSNAPAIIHII